MTKGTGFFGAGVVFIAAVVGAALALWTMTGSGQAASTRVAIDGDDILGVVTTSNGSAASVWVIAQTTDLPTRFRKIAVTHDQGRYVLPVLPKASYGIWVRGHGLVYSASVQFAPGQLNLDDALAPTPRAAAAVHPANYWYSMIRVPPKSDFPSNELLDRTI